MEFALQYLREEYSANLADDMLAVGHRVCCLPPLVGLVWLLCLCAEAHASASTGGLHKCTPFRC